MGLAILIHLSFRAFGGPADSLLALADRSTDPQQRDALRYEAGLRYYRSGAQDTAMRVFAHTRTSPNAEIRIRTLNAIGNIHADRGDNPKALEHYQQALTESEKAGNTEQTAQTLKNIGALYISWKRFDEALAYYEKADTQARILKDSALIADLYNNKGTVYEQQEKLQQALQVYQSALEYYRGANRRDGMAMTLSNLAIVYKRLGNYAAAIDANKRSLGLSRETGDDWMVAATLNNIGNAYGELKQYREAIDYCNQSLATARRIDAKEIIVAAYSSMGDAATKAGDYRAAVNYYRAHDAAKDSFISTESTRQLSELQVKYETAKKERENEVLSYKAILAERRRMLTVYISIGVILALGAIFGLIYRNRRVRDRLHEERQVAQAMIDSEQRERIRIARDLHDSIGQMLAVVRMQVSVLEEEAPGELRERAVKAAELVDRTASEVRSISHNLIPEELNFGLVSAIRALCEKISTVGSLQAFPEIPEPLRQKKFPINLELSLYRIIQEVFTGMIRHSGASIIRIRIELDGANLLFTLNDNGKGFDSARVTDSAGLGWKNIAARVRLLQGKMEVGSERDQGTEVRIRVPF
jgi:two-component system NarL family sensor kinase